MRLGRGGGQVVSVLNLCSINRVRISLSLQFLLCKLFEKKENEAKGAVDGPFLKRSRQSFVIFTRLAALGVSSQLAWCSSVIGKFVDHNGLLVNGKHRSLGIVLTGLEISDIHSGMVFCQSQREGQVENAKLEHFDGWDWICKIYREMTFEKTETLGNRGIFVVRDRCVVTDLCDVRDSDIK